MKVIVIGDIFLDRYFYYNPQLGLPSLETGIKPIVTIDESFAPGAAGNVAKDLTLFGAEVRIASVIGEDGNAFELVKTLRLRGINTDFLVKSSRRSTPVYTKFVNIQDNIEDLPRVDLLPTKPLNKNVIDELVRKINENLEWADAVVVIDQMEDPALGVITKEVKALLDSAKKESSKPFFVDSRSRSYDFAGYIVKPNLHEFEMMMSHLDLSVEKDLPLQIATQKYASKISGILGSDLVVTASEDGAYVTQNGELFRVFSIPTDVVDVTGAGDAFMAAMIVKSLRKDENTLVKSASAGLKAGNLCVSLRGTGEFNLDDLSKLPDPKVDKVSSNGIFVNHPKNVEKFEFALFDFDGTLSLLREGWQSIMKEMMIEEITGGSNLPDDEFSKMEEETEEYIDRTTGQQTILQMMDLEKMVRDRGLVSKDKIKTPMEYKEIYNRKLKRIVKERVKNTQKDRYLLMGAREFLVELREHGMKILAFSGTDVEDVVDEAEILGIKEFFDAGIHGAVGSDYKEHTKEMVVRRLLEKTNLKGETFVIFGDGPVEISVGRDFGAFTVGIASNEKKGFGWNPKKFNRLKVVGADVIIPDFTVRNDLKNILIRKYQV